jgi:hypothetical protein
VNEDTVGIPIRRSLGNVGEIDLKLRTAVHFNELADGEAMAYVIRLALYQIHDEE